MNTENGFASAMQQLSAEAAKTLPPERPGLPEVGETVGSSAVMLKGLVALGTRVQNLEATFKKGFEEIGAGMPADFAGKFNQMGEQIIAIRNTETTNQKLFDSLHEELIQYRDNFLHESLQKPFIRDLVVLFDDLTTLSSQLSIATKGEAKKKTIGQWHDNLENSIHSLMEVLHRLEVREIEPQEKVDRTYHRVVNFETAEFPEDEGRIVMRVRRGFLWRDKVLRPEEVIAKRFE